MTISRNAVFYFFIAFIFIALKAAFSFAETDQLTFLLWPTSVLVAFFSDSYSVFLPGEGYFHPEANILIDKSCSGFGFCILCFALLSFLAVKHLNSNRHKLLVLPLVFCFAWFYSIFINSSRIAVSVVVQNAGNYLLPKRPHLRLHDAAGILVYLFSLLAIYLLAEFLLTKRQKHAQHS